MTCSTSYCVVTVSGIHEMYIVSYCIVLYCTIMYFITLKRVLLHILSLALRSHYIYIYIHIYTSFTIINCGTIFFFCSLHLL